MIDKVQQARLWLASAVNSSPYVAKWAMEAAKYTGEDVNEAVAKAREQNRVEQEYCRKILHEDALKRGASSIVYHSDPTHGRERIGHMIERHQRRHPLPPNAPIQRYASITPKTYRVKAMALTTPNAR